MHNEQSEGMATLDGKAENIATYNTQNPSVIHNTEV